MLQKINKNSNIMYFDTDKDFYDFAVVQKVMVNPLESNPNVWYCDDFEFSKEYNNAIESGKKFIIKDLNSEIFKHGAIAGRYSVKPVLNLEPYFGEV